MYRICFLFIVGVISCSAPLPPDPHQQCIEMCGSSGVQKYVGLTHSCECRNKEYKVNVGIDANKK